MNETELERALRLRRAGKLAEAAEIYSEVLRAEPRNFEALHALGILRYQGGQLADAVRLIGEAAAINPHAADAAYNHACLLQKLNRPEDALSAFDRAIAIRPDYIEALVNRGTVLALLKRYDEALANSERVITLKPLLAEGWSNRGGLFMALGRYQEALSSYDRAVALKPSYADAWNNRAALLIVLRRYPEALLAVDKALELAPQAADFLRRRADALSLLNRSDEAVAVYDNYLALKPDDPDAWHSRGLALKALRRRVESLSCFDKAVLLAAANTEFRKSRANMLYELDRFDEAARDYELLLADQSSPAWVRGYLTLCRMHVCDWRSLGEERAKIAAELKAGRFAIDPMGDVVITDSLEEQLRCARIWAADCCPLGATPLWTGEIYRHDRIRLAYLSSDFRTHATAFLMAGVFENHDRTRFETVAISYSTDEDTPMRTRLGHAFDRFIDVKGKSDLEVARLLREMEIDIAVDLKGYTAESRPGILAHRAAPVQAQYLGFPGTMGVNFVDYLIADPIVVPETHRPFYTEAIAYLPDSYQCNDRKRTLPERTPLRLELGLPPGFVFCCFNNNQKLTPEMFDVWMRLLDGVPGSVLWLYRSNQAVGANLRREAKARGVDPERLIFAAPVDHPTHLARQRQADLFLDTLPYNAHTTASDALWMGVPVVTALGSSFAGRVAGSLLRAAGVPELVTGSVREYEALALKLAREPAALAAFKARLRANRDTCALFDTIRFTRNLEFVYATMWERQQRGLPPETFTLEGAVPS